MFLVVMALLLKSTFAAALVLSLNFLLIQKVLGNDFLDDFQVMNPNKIYHSFPTHPRVVKPDGFAEDAGECCMLFDHVEVPVGKSVTFHSPNYPKSYPSDMICGWNFTTNVSYTFDMHCHFNHLKRDDFFTMLDKEYNLYSHIENIREKEVYHYFRSDSVQVGFHSNEIMSAKGFECTIWPVEKGCPAPAASVKTYLKLEGKYYGTRDEALEKCGTYGIAFPESQEILDYMGSDGLRVGARRVGSEYRKYKNDELLTNELVPWRIEEPRGLECVEMYDKEFTTYICDQQQGYYCYADPTGCDDTMSNCFEV